MSAKASDIEDLREMLERIVYRNTRMLDRSGDKGDPVAFVRLMAGYKSHRPPAPRRVSRLRHRPPRDLLGSPRSSREAEAVRAWPDSLGTAMYLNFADPPIPPDWSVFEPSVGPEEAPSALERIAQTMRSSEVLTTAFPDDGIEPATIALEDPRLATTYATGAPMIARFLTIELDTEHKISKGIGRVAPRDPPPRFGAKYRRKLREPVVADEMGRALENLALHGFAAAAAFNACLDEPADLQERELAERWRLLVRNLTPTWHDLVQQLDLDSTNPDPGTILVFGVIQPAGDNYVVLAEKLRLGRFRPFGTPRMITYMHFFAALGWLVFNTGTDRAVGTRK